VTGFWAEVNSVIGRPLTGSLAPESSRAMFLIRL
jgi:hypothetical protein